MAGKFHRFAERREARDLVDIMAVLKQRPELRGEARRLIDARDALILAERLVDWTDSSLRDEVHSPGLAAAGPPPGLGFLLQVDTASSRKRP